MNVEGSAKMNVPIYKTASYPSHHCVISKNFPDSFLCRAQNVKMLSKYISFRWNATSPSCDHFLQFLQI